jgi:hypothetical protein
MDKVVVYYHKESDTLDIWFGNPEDEFMWKGLRGQTFKIRFSDSPQRNFPRPERKGGEKD